MLHSITPVVLTFNEAPNIARTLAALSWAKEVVVVDSASSDGTQAIVTAQAKCRLLEHPFHDHATQWRFALDQVPQDRPWVLRLDADYLLTPELVAEIAALSPGEEVSAYQVAFTYCQGGTPLRASLYPPKAVLFRPERARVYQSGHSERWSIEGKTLSLANKVLHDDRKAFARWFLEQKRYMTLEAEQLLATPREDRRASDKLRAWIIAVPLVLPFYLLFGQGLILDGKAGLCYVLQRWLAECLLSGQLIKRHLRRVLGMGS